MIVITKIDEDRVLAIQDFHTNTT